ncbi:hypothetical protein [Polaribacter sargassicola]|uniref:hypothetical protein n=1 Tax=Polaribacter sargassicola TaxID=2836891 RepID=UPI001F3BE416|nr:hypothetical protein [Polaribacter sp. DS7-9]MCG1035514.1 hypothetical protein [Polaribacter sp. DS7-9]
MDKLNTTELNAVLKDVRSSYRLLALYQKRLLDIVKYTASTYNVSFNSGWSKFSNAASHGNKASIDKSSWDWLTMYLYEFNLGSINIDGDIYNFKIVHQSDSGFYDVSKDQKTSKDNVDQFADVSVSCTRLFFVISKIDDGCPMINILNGHLSAQNNSNIEKGNWLAVPYNLQYFSNQADTDIVLNEFNAVCKEIFGVDLINGLKTKKEIIDIINSKYDASLTDNNTNCASISSSKKVWWFTIPVLKFEEDIHLLLNTTDRVIWIVLPKGLINLNLLKVREDSEKIDLEISADGDHKFLHDIKSGGTEFDFSEFVREEIRF